MKKTTIPKLLTWVTIIGLAFLLFMTFLRFVFFFRFHAPGTSFKDFLGPFLLGLNYDLRIVCGSVIFPFLLGNLVLGINQKGKLTIGSFFKIGLTIIVMAALLFFMKKGHVSFAILIFFGFLFVLILLWAFITKNCNPFENGFSRRIIKGWFYFVSTVLVVFYAFDMEHYDYLQQRLSASIINFTGDAKISMNMIWETYPVFKLLIFMAISLAILIWTINFSFKKINKRIYNGGITRRFVVGLIFALLLALGIFGRINQYPLRWSDAFVFRDDFKSNLALNPIQSFFSTMQFRNSGYDLDLVKKYYPLMSKYLKVTNSDENKLNFKRRYIAPPGTVKRNVVIVICESFSMYKSSMSGNKLNTTPYFNSLCNDGIFFDRCFTPSFGTARGVWATITGIPDVEYPNTSSRNPSFVDQHSILNDYTGYSKYYFIGGSSSWANIRGLLINNILDLNLLEEEDFNAKRVDVWGISDKRLLLAANDTFVNQKKPFVAVIQTADNHRPYTIPEEDRNEFKIESYPKDTLYKYGFTDNDEFNAFRYTDFAFKKFMEAAKKEDYFKNTLFVFVGDHGIRGDMTTEYPKSWTDAGLSIHHVPLLFYAPDFLIPEKIHQVCSQSDLLPTASALAGISYTNTTMGINLFDTLKTNLLFPHVAFIFDPTIKQIGIVTDSFIYNHNLLSNKQQVFSMAEGRLPSSAEEKQMSNITTAWYQTARYLLSNNQKRRIAGNN